LKYTHTFPERFGSLADAQRFMAGFVDDYNHHHKHTGIQLHTPAAVHYGLAAAKNEHRSQALAAARSTSPSRFATSHDPKVLNLPEAA
jgi:putative transposase